MNTNHLVYIQSWIDFHLRNRGQLLEAIRALKPTQRVRQRNLIAAIQYHNSRIVSLETTGK